MYFSILLCHASMNCWKDSSWMPLSWLRDDLCAFKTCSFDNLLEIEERSKKKKSQTEEDQVNREDVPVRRCSRAGTVGVASRCRAVLPFVLAQLPSLLALWAKQTPQTFWLAVWFCGKDSLWTIPLPSKNVITPVTFQTDLVCASKRYAV